MQSYLQAKRFGQIPEFISEYTFPSPEDDVTLVFNSKFESGNLKKAIKMSDYEYKLLLNSDTNTYGQNHWYYFTVFNPRKSPITFQIINMLKFDDLYKAGLQPAIFSQKYCEKTGTRWHRDGSKIDYFMNSDSLPGKPYYTLSFTYDFRYCKDLVHFAYSIPYTYTDLSRYLYFIKEKYENIARVDPLCTSLAGNTCEMLTITENIKTYKSFEDETHEWGISSAGRRMMRNKLKRKRNQAKLVGKKVSDEHEEKFGVVLTSRVHSGETVSSFMMNGAIEFLLGESRGARILRKKFVFKIVPMLNPDGVRYGNYRCSLLGVDLNRRWDKPSKVLHPTIYYAKKMIEVFGEQHKIMMSCDMHGHSKKRNIFMYGCAKKSTDCLEVRKNIMAKVVPYVMGLKSKFFNFRNCHFRIEKSKASTARIVICSEFGIVHSYTMEASFFGPLNKEFLMDNYHTTEKDLETVGEELCKTCLIFTSQALYLSKVRNTNNFLRGVLLKKSNTVNLSEKKSFSSEEDEAKEQEIEGSEDKNSIDEDLGKNQNIKKENEIQDEKEKSLECDERENFVNEKVESLEIGLSENKEIIQSKKKFERIEKIENIEKNEKSGKKEKNKKSGKTERLKKKFKGISFENEKMWEGIDIVEYVESDEEGSGGSDSCPSEKLEELEELIPSYPIKHKNKIYRKKHLKTDFYPEPMSEHPKSNIDSHHESYDEKLTKTYSLKPKFRAIQSRRVHSKEETGKSHKGAASSNLKSQNILFNYPTPQIYEKPAELLAKIQKDLSKKKSTFLKCPEISEESQGQLLKSMTRVQNSINYSFDQISQKKNTKDMHNVGVFNSPTMISEFSWGSNRPSYIAKNYADSARYRIDKLYAKFGL